MMFHVTAFCLHNFSADHKNQLNNRFRPLTLSNFQLRTYLINIPKTPKKIDGDGFIFLYLFIYRK